MEGQQQHHHKMPKPALGPTPRVFPPKARAAPQGSTPSTARSSPAEGTSTGTKKIQTRHQQQVEPSLPGGKRVVEEESAPESYMEPSRPSKRTTPRVASFSSLIYTPDAEGRVISRKLISQDSRGKRRKRERERGAYFSDHFLQTSPSLSYTSRIVIGLEKVLMEPFMLPSTP